MNQQITFLSDGADTVRELQLYFNPQAEHLLDWFHITMRITVMNQLAKGLGPEDCELRMIALKELESIKWYLWHGNVFQALQHIEFLEMDLDDKSARKLRRAVGEFHTYIDNNQRWIPNYGERWRAGETISTAFVESTVNQVISKRFVKRQQMRWTRAVRICCCRCGREFSMKSFGEAFKFGIQHSTGEPRDKRGPLSSPTFLRSPSLALITA